MAAKTGAAAGKNDLPSGYETTFITSPEMTDDALAELKKKLEEVVKTFKGNMIHTEDWGKRKMAYPIRKETRGHYSFMIYDGDGGVVTELERTLRLQEPILRFLSVRLEHYDLAKVKRGSAGLHRPEPAGFGFDRGRREGGGRSYGGGGGGGYRGGRD